MPEGEHFTPEMLDRDEHPNDVRRRGERLQRAIDALPDDVKWSIEQIRAQCGRVMAGDSGLRSESRALAQFVQTELLDALVPALSRAFAVSIPPPQKDQS